MRAVAWVVMAMACGGGTDGVVPDFPRACDQSGADGDCIEYSGSSWVEGDVVDNCADGEVLDACPEGAIDGRCFIDEGLPFETVSYFYPGFWDGQRASYACSNQVNSRWDLP